MYARSGMFQVPFEERIVEVQTTIQMYGFTFFLNLARFCSENKINMLNVIKLK